MHHLDLYTWYSLQYPKLQRLTKYKRNGVIVLTQKQSKDSQHKNKDSQHKNKDFQHKIHLA